jgi:hypothetical protein
MAENTNSLVYVYISPYGIAKAVAKFISFIGWLTFVISTLVFVVSLLSLISGNALISFFVIGWTFLTVLGSALTGLFLIIAGYVARATLDSADYNREMLAIMQANLLAQNVAQNKATEY